MNAQTGRLTALDAAMQAGLAATQPRFPAAVTGAGPGDSPTADSAAVSMLWRIRRRIGPDARLLLQFVPCGADAESGNIAAGVARAAAGHEGRTLLVDASRASAPDAAPDAYVKGLYHQQAQDAGLHALLTRPQGVAGAAAEMFRAIIVSQKPPLASEGAYAFGPLCTGTILVVRAGLSELRQISAIVQRLQAVGGVVLGTVLAGGRG